MTTIIFDPRLIEPRVQDLPDIVGIDWRKRKAEAIRRVFISRLRDDWLACATQFRRGIVKYVAGVEVMSDESLIDEWTKGANKFFAPVFERGDAGYWIDHDRGDLWHMAGLSRGAAEDKALTAEQWFARGFGV